MVIKKYCSNFSSLKNKTDLTRKTRPDTAKLLVFVKSAAKYTLRKTNSFMSAKISQTSVIDFNNYE